MTKDEYAEVTSSSPMWGLDCEMCRTTMDSELTRVSIVDENKQVSSHLIYIYINI